MADSRSCTEAASQGARRRHLLPEPGPGRLACPTTGEGARARSARARDPCSKSSTTASRCLSRRSTSGAAPQQAAHSDALHFSSEPEGFMCGVWVALEDIDMRQRARSSSIPAATGCPMVTMEDVGARGANDRVRRLRAPHRGPDRARGPRASIRRRSARARRSCGRRTCCTAARSRRSLAQPPQPGDATTSSRAVATGPR